MGTYLPMRRGPRYQNITRFNSMPDGDTHELRQGLANLECVYVCTYVRTYVGMYLPVRTYI